MTDILMILALLLFLLFLVSGLVSHFKKADRKWMYLALSVLSLVGVIVMFSYSNLDNKESEKSEKSTTIDQDDEVDVIEPDTSIDKKQDNQIDSDQEKPPIHKIPDSIDEPKEDPKDEPKEEHAPDPIKQPATSVPTTSQKILVPDTGTIDYKVVSGDTLWSIATRAGVTVEKLKQWNNLESATIQVGQILKLYGKNIEPVIPLNPPKQVTPPVSCPSVLISNGSLKQKEIAFTFDAGSDAVGIRILDVLKKHNVKATFFLTGKWAEKFPSYARRIANEGHEIGNHTYSHPDAVTISDSTLKLEISKAEQTIKLASGTSPQPYFRFPYGSYDTPSLKVVGEIGYPYSIQWSLDTIDWQQPSVETIISRIETGASNGDIILMHIGGQNTPEAVDQVIPLLKEKGYKLVTLSELLQ